MGSKKGDCLDSNETKSYSLDKTGGQITFKGWGLAENFNEVILEELKDYFESEINNLKIISKVEQSFTSSQYYEGELAHDAGHGFWVEFEKGWRKGLGKCTTFELTYELKEED